MEKLLCDVESLENIGIDVSFVSDLRKLYGVEEGSTSPQVALLSATSFLSSSILRSDEIFYPSFFFHFVNNKVCQMAASLFGADDGSFLQHDHIAPVLFKYAIMESAM